MSKYTASIIFAADTSIEVEADSPEEVAEKAYESEEANISLCHHCAQEVNLGDCIRVIVCDEAGNEVFDDGYAETLNNALKAKLALAEKQRDELLSAAEKALAECVDLIATDAGNALESAIAKARGEA